MAMPCIRYFEKEAYNIIQLEQQMIVELMLLINSAGTADNSADEVQKSDEYCACHHVFLAQR